MSSPWGSLRAEMFMRTLPVRGVPPRGSLQDRVAQVMISRERRRNVSEHVYLGRILAAGMKLPPATFQLWTSLFAMEVHQESYALSAVEAKRSALESLSEDSAGRVKSRARVFTKLENLTATEEDLRPVSAEEREIFKRRLRRRFLQPAKKE